MSRPLGVSFGHGMTRAINPDVFACTGWLKAQFQSNSTQKKEKRLEFSYEAVAKSCIQPGFFRIMGACEAYAEEPTVLSWL